MLGYKFENYFFNQFIYFEKSPQYTKKKHKQSHKKIAKNSKIATRIPNKNKVYWNDGKTHYVGRKDVFYFCGKIVWKIKLKKEQSKYPQLVFDVHYWKYRSTVQPNFNLCFLIFLIFIPFLFSRWRFWLSLSHTHILIYI